MIMTDGNTCTYMNGLTNNNKKSQSPDINAIGNQSTLIAGSSPTNRLLQRNTQTTELQPSSSIFEDGRLNH